MDTPLQCSPLCGLFGGRGVLGHQHLFLTLETGESGKVVFFFPWRIPSLLPASFRGGSSECFSVYAEGDAYSACPSGEFRNVKAGGWGLCGLEGPVERAENTWSEPREQRRRTKATREPPGQGLEAWEFPGLSVKSGSNGPGLVQEL